LSIPLEDLTDGWEQSGSVGQEIYGAGFAFVATTRHFRALPKTDLVFHCDYPVFDFEYTGDAGGGHASFRLGGERRGIASVRLIPRDANLSAPLVTCRRAGRAVAVAMSPEGHHVVKLSGDQTLQVSWKRAKQTR
jgi:hypothetical protein